MKQEARAAVYDEKLRVEAYRLAGMAQPFPAHFHAYYVIGLVTASPLSNASLNAGMRSKGLVRSWSRTMPGASASSRSAAAPA